jgi:hypothetical protein
VLTASDFWSYARECELWATKLADEADCRIFFEMAKAWEQLARKEQSVYRPPGQFKSRLEG